MILSYFTFRKRCNYFNATMKQIFNISLYDLHYGGFRLFYAFSPDESSRYPIDVDADIRTSVMSVAQQAWTLGATEGKHSIVTVRTEKKIRSCNPTIAENQRQHELHDSQQF